VLEPKAGGPVTGLVGAPDRSRRSRTPRAMARFDEIIVSTLRRKSSSGATSSSASSASGPR
jgi:hypothetical protein